VSAGPVVRLVLPTRVPYGAHALWIQGGTMDQAEGEERVSGTDWSSVNLGSEAMDEARVHYSSSTPRATAAVLQYLLPEPFKFKFEDSQAWALGGHVAMGVMRLASGLFVNGWRPWVGFDEPLEYAFVRGMGMQFKELRNLGKLREQQDAEERAIMEDTILSGNSTHSAATPQATTTLTLWEIEGDGGCKRVREVLSMLDIAVECRPCPYGSRRHRVTAATAQGVSPIRIILPYLEDVSTGARISGADEVVKYLYNHYLDGNPPPLLVRDGPGAAARAAIAVAVRGGSGSVYTRPTRVPSQPLEFWAYEASPFCGMVREALCELELPYILRPCARGSPRRTALWRRAGGVFQVPYLIDPNTGVEMFESAAIVAYLRRTYLC